MSKILKGKKLMVFVQDGDAWKSVAYATSHSLSVTTSTVDISTKDNEDTTGVGAWVSEEIDTFSWTMTTENLIGVDGKGMSFDELMTKFLTGASVKVRFNLAATSTTGPQSANGWTEASGELDGYEGNAIITQLDVNASNGDNASFSATFTGQGALSKIA